MESMFPLHSATSSALMTPMMHSVARHSYGWLSEEVLSISSCSSSGF